MKFILHRAKFYKGSLLGKYIKDDMYKIPPKLGSSSLCWARGSCQKNLVPTTQPSGSYIQPNPVVPIQPNPVVPIQPNPVVPIQYILYPLKQKNLIRITAYCLRKNVAVILHTWANLHYIFIPTKYLHYMNVYKNKFKNEYMTYIGNLYYIFVRPN